VGKGKWGNSTLLQRIFLKKGLKKVNFFGHLSSRKVGFLKKLFEFFFVVWDGVVGEREWNFFFNF